MLSLGLNMAAGSVMQSSALLLLDEFTSAAAAYSLRKLRADYTGKVVKLRRESDHVEVDVSFDINGVLSLDSTVTNVVEASTGVTPSATTTAASKLGEFVGEARRSGGDSSYSVVDSMTESVNVAVVTWYDQSGNSDDVSQAAATAQPSIYDRSSGLVLENGKPAVYFNDNTKQLAKTSGWGGSNILTCDFLNVHRRASGSGFPLFYYNGLFQVIHYLSSSYKMGWGGPTVGPSTDTDQHLFYGIASNTVGQIILDGTASTAGTLSGSRHFSGAFAFQGRPGNPGSYAAPEIYHQEFVQWDRNQTDRTGIETNINTFYSIY